MRLGETSLQRPRRHADKHSERPGLGWHRSSGHCSRANPRSAARSTPVGDPVPLKAELIHTGREDNIFWRRGAGGAGGLIEASGVKSLGERCAEPLGRDVIHSVTNPLGRLTAAIHLYGGAFYGAKRSDWDPKTMLESAITILRCTGACRNVAVRRSRHPRRLAQLL